MRITVLEPKTHRRNDFDCGDASLNDFLKKQAGQVNERNYGKTYVAFEETDPGRISGFCTISVGLVSFDEIPDSILRKLPRYPMPVVHLGRLAVDLGCQRRGVGKALLRFVLLKTAQIADEMGVHALEVIAKDQAAFDYYLSYGFTPLTVEKRRLFMPVATIRAALR